jgi:hypothetical protein
MALFNNPNIIQLISKRLTNNLVVFYPIQTLLTLKLIKELKLTNFQNQMKSFLGN